MRYAVICHTCKSESESNWFSKAKSDADWHNTMTGHVDIVVVHEEDGERYSVAELADTLCYYCGENTTDDPEGEYLSVGVRGIAHASCIAVRE